MIEEAINKKRLKLFAYSIIMTSKNSLFLNYGVYFQLDRRYMKVIPNETAIKKISTFVLFRNCDFTIGGFRISSVKKKWVQQFYCTKKLNLIISVIF